MKKLFSILYFIFTTGISLQAQTPLPYYTGFSHGEEGWTSFSKGNTSDYAWELVNIRTSPPDNIGLHHPSLEFANAGDTSIDWFVSPAFLFPTGGKIDSFTANIYLWGGAMDSIDVYLLIGSNDPDLATSKIKLAGLIGMKTNTSFDVRDTGNFQIPVTTDSTYIAFRFTAVATDWYEVRIDDLYISGNPGTAVSNIAADNSFNIYPNPARNEIKVFLPTNTGKNATIIITNALGQIMHRQQTVAASLVNINISDWPEGLYFVSVQAGSRICKTQKLIVSN